MKPMTCLVALAPALILVGCTSASGESGTAAASSAMPAHAMATASLKAADGSDRGTAEVMEMPDGLMMTIKAVGFTPGAHGAHVHMTGVCTPPDFASAGGHWNPTGKKHGKNNPDGMHMGDMPNILIGADGSGELQFTIPGATLKSGPTPILDADGAAVVIHAVADDLASDPAGNAGGRLACGVLTAS